MPVSHARVSVDDSPRVAVATGDEPQPQTIKNKGTNSVYLGDVTVLSSTGFELASGEAVVISLEGADTLYGICASGESCTLHKLTE